MAANEIKDFTMVNLMSFKLPFNAMSLDLNILNAFSDEK